MFSTSFGSTIHPSLSLFDQDTSPPLPTYTTRASSSSSSSLSSSNPSQSSSANYGLLQSPSRPSLHRSRCSLSPSPPNPPSTPLPPLPVFTATTSLPKFPTAPRPCSLPRSIVPSSDSDSVREEQQQQQPRVPLSSASRSRRRRRVDRTGAGGEQENCSATAPRLLYYGNKFRSVGNPSAAGFEEADEGGREDFEGEAEEEEGDDERWEKSSDVTVTASQPRARSTGQSTRYHASSGGGNDDGDRTPTQEFDRQARGLS